MTASGTFDSCEVAFTVAPFYLVRMLQRTLAAGFIAPCLPTKTHEPPSGRLWIHEIKHDGFRIIARKNGDRVRLSSIAVPAMVHSARKNLNEVRQNPSL